MRLSAGIALLCLLFLSPGLMACEPWAGRIVAVNGLVVADIPGESGSRRTVSVDSILCPGQRLLTGDSSRAAVYLSNNSFVRLDQNTILTLPEQNSSASYWVRLQQGIVHIISRITRRFEVQTPYVNAAVEGTEFLVAVNDKQASISVIEGTVTATDGKPAMDQAVNAGEKLIAYARGASHKVIQVEKIDVIDWAIYYPPLFALQQLNHQQQQWLDAAAEHLTRSRPDLALQELNRGDPGEVSIRVAKAAVLLSVGQVEAAQKALDKLQTSPALALRSIVHSATNRAEQALSTARQAVAADNQSPAALIALSYAQQANLDLDAALETALQAKDLRPQSSLIWSRVSELQLALGNIRQARKSAQQAVEVDADDPQALTQLAFINLFSLKLNLAKDQFQQAIQKDSENPRAHLGFGLTLLRQGDLEAGRTRLEIATSLDPARSVLRSYLGRAYFEEKRDAEAQVQWQLAKEFDPQDPTPWFYEGVRKLFANDPIGAIVELEVSRDLNDERALYRSETLLQSDAASRSATLARAYDEAGYQQGVLLAARNSLRSDRTNAEGHRLLADHYLGNSRFEVARASELLQSQLWQPLSTYPLQPQLSESDIAYIEGSGPQRPGFNEYHSLFTQNGLYAAFSSYGAEDGIWGNDVVATYLTGPVAISIGQYHYEADGWRKNSSQEQDIYNGLLQWQVAPSTSIQIEARKLQWTQEDLAPQFLNVVSSTRGRDIEQETYRFGWRQGLGHAHGFVLSLIQQDRSVYELSDAGTESDIFTSKEDEAAELQFYSTFDGYSLIYGLGYMERNQEVNIVAENEGTIDTILDGVRDLYRVLQQRSENEFETPNQLNGYLYAYKDLSESVAIELGLTYDVLEHKQVGEVVQQVRIFRSSGDLVRTIDLSPDPQLFSDQTNEVGGKLGVSVSLTTGLIARAAVFTTYRRLLTGNQTIEPTTLMGFSQFFDEENGVDGRNLALALDYNWGSQLKFGTSYIRRLLKNPVISGNGSQNDIVQIDIQESIANAYVTYFPDSRVAFSLELNWDSRERNSGIELRSDLVNYLERYSVPVNIDIFYNESLSLNLRQTYFRQSLREIDKGQLFENDAWTTDISAKLRIGSRSGFIEVGIKNTMDETDEFVSHDGALLAFYPGRLWYATFNVNL